MTLDRTKYEFDSFDLDKALAGKPIAATFGEDSSGPIYKLVEQFYRESSDFALYKVLIESTYYTFNSDGVGTVTIGEGPSAEEVDSQLYMCKGIIDPARPSTSEEVIEVGPQNQTRPFYLPSLNFRETVALQALNAIISHYDNPIGYNTASIKLMITKAFEFAGEFVNQAVVLRQENAQSDPEHSGEYIVEDPPEIAALKDIRTGINEMKDDLKSAFIGGTEQNPIKLIDQVVAIKNSTEELKNSTEELKDAMYVEEDNDTISITEKVAAVANAVTTGDANIVSALGTTNTRLNTIAGNTSDIVTNTASTNDKLDVANGKLAEIDSNTENIEVSVTAEVDVDSMTTAVADGIDSSFVLGGSRGTLSSIEDALTNHLSSDTIAGHVKSIDSKV